jgi:hypothetical protein
MMPEARLVYPERLVVNSQYLPFELGIKDALWIYLKRLGVFLAVTAFAFAICAVAGLCFATGWKTTVTVPLRSVVLLTLLVPLLPVLLFTFFRKQLRNHAHRRAASSASGEIVALKDQIVALKNAMDDGRLRRAASKANLDDGSGPEFAVLTGALNDAYAELDALTDVLGRGCAEVAAMKDHLVAAHTELVALKRRLAAARLGRGA